MEIAETTQVRAMSLFLFTTPKFARFVSAFCVTSQITLAFSIVNPLNTLQKCDFVSYDSFLFQNRMWHRASTENMTKS